MCPVHLLYAAAGKEAGQEEGEVAGATLNFLPAARSVAGGT